MKFIADVMLGRLAKRLRLLGFDVLYDRTLDDNEIIRLSLEQHRLILTRDKTLAERPLASSHLYIESEKVQEQIQQVLASCPLDQPAQALSRCSQCNTILSEISKDDVKDLVPQYVYERYNDFRHCTGCGRVYWMGTHVQKMGFRK
jgi:hypothetical protein